jgi:hypothetical protein
MSTILSAGAELGISCIYDVKVYKTSPLEAIVSVIDISKKRNIEELLGG